MRNLWKAATVILLVIAVGAAFASKRKAHQRRTAPAPGVAGSAAPTGWPPGRLARGLAPGSEPRRLGPRGGSPQGTAVSPRTDLATQAPARPPAPPQAAPKPASLSRAPAARAAVTQRGEAASAPPARPPVASTKPASSQPLPPAAAKPTALPQLVEFGSHTCIPCQKMMPILDELRKEYAGRLEIIFYDVYEHRDKATQSRIRVIPTQIFIGPDGREFSRHEGFFPKADILARFKAHGIALAKAS